MQCRLAVWLCALLLIDAVEAAEQVSLVRQDSHSVALMAYPVERDSCRGVAIISHGAGGSEAGYAYLAQALAEHGWLTIVPGHQESGRDALKDLVRQHGVQGGLERLITSPSAYRGRFMDIAAARNWGMQRCASSGSVLLGHSMGAATAMIEAGAKNNLGLGGADNFDLYVTLSPQGVGGIFPGHAWQGLTKPVLMLTGTKDGELGGSSWQTRVQAFADMSPGCKWLGVIDGASHMNFAGRGISGKTQTITVKTVLAFLKAPPACQLPPALDGIDLQGK